MKHFLNRIPWRLCVAMTLLACVLWWLHAFLNVQFPPNAGPLDTSLFIVTCMSKFLAWVSFPFFFRRIGLHLQGNRQLLKRAVLCWLGGFVALMVVYAGAHDFFARILSNDTARFFYVSDSSPLSKRHYIGREEWLVRWHSGQVVLLESGLGLILVGLVALTLYRWGKRWWTAFALPVAITGIAVAYCFTVKLSVWGYDFFIGSLYSDCLALDNVLCFVANDPTSEITFPVWLTFVGTSLLAIRRLPEMQETCVLAPQTSQTAGPA